MRLRFTALLTVAVTIIMTGCATLGDKLKQQALPEGAPDAGQILASLALNEQGMKGFRASGTVILQSPELESTQISRESTIIYRQPLDLHVIGRKYGTRFVELTCAGQAFLLQFPTERQFYYRPLGERFETVSSADMAREMFKPETWLDLSPKQVRILSYDAATQTASMVILDRDKGNRPRRQLTVQGTPWVVLQNRLLDQSGKEVAVTTKSDYYERDGVRFPRKVESVFPGERARMSFTMRKLNLNPETDGKIFDVDGSVRELRKRGCQQVETLRGSGQESVIDNRGDGGYVDNFDEDEKELETTK